MFEEGNMERTKLELLRQEIKIKTLQMQLPNVISRERVAFLRIGARRGQRDIFCIATNFEPRTLAVGRPY
jgi:hypothetical protein